MTHLDLFTGIGGFKLAAQWAGYETVGFSEICPFASKILKQHWPHIKNYGDIKTADFSDLPRVNLLTGGFPCQPFSVAGKKRGKEDDRHLWPEMLRVIAQVKPDFILGENVAGFIGMELDNVLIDLEAIGYATWPLVIPACAVDAHHQRKRVWIMAISTNSRSQGLHRWEVSAIEDVADSRCQSEGIESNGFNHKLQDGSEEGFGTETRNGSSNSGQDAPHAMRQGLEGQRKISCGTGKKQRDIGNGCRWEPEPAICRVANGIPNRSHRIKGLGNSIVPQVAYQIIKAIPSNPSTIK